MEPPLSIEARQHDQQQAVARKDNEIEDTHRVDILSIIIQAKLIAFRLSCAKEKHSIRLLVGLVFTRTRAHWTRPWAATRVTTIYWLNFSPDV